MGTVLPKVAAASPLQRQKAGGLPVVPLPSGPVHVGKGSPYARIGLWRNPFGELTRGERAELAVIDVARCLEKLSHSRSALQILGPCGRGKTTHLLAIELAVSGCGYVYFPEDGSQPPLPRGRPLLVDEAQRLGWRRRWQLLRVTGPLVLGTHVDMSGLLQRGGFDVSTIDVSIPKTPAELQRIFNFRIEASRLDARCTLVGDRRPHTLCLTLDDVVDLHQQFGSNIRRMEHHLYDVFQHLAEKGNSWPPAK